MHEIAKVIYSLQYTDLLYILFIGVYILNYRVVYFRDVYSLKGLLWIPNHSCLTQNN